MSLINSQHISAYFQCPRKGYLLLTSGLKYQMTDYETLVSKAQEQAFDIYCSKIEALNYKEDLLKKGASVVLNTKITFEQYDFDCKVLFKKEGKSLFGKFYYEPCIFLGTTTACKENRMELVFLCILLEKIQGKFPDKAWFINRKGNQHRFKTTNLRNEIKAAINDIKDFKKKAPKLILNKHCSYCSFHSICKEQAVKDDNLTLLDRISIKQVNKLEKKGIFTITQLSYIYKQRRKGKRFKNLIYTYKPELQALAIRTNKTYIQKLPTLDRKFIEIFLDIESEPEENFFYLFGILISEGNQQLYHSFWSDTLKDEGVSWEGAHQVFESYPEAPIYHYGSFESTAFDILSKRYKTNIEPIKKRLINVNTFIFGKIYFPTYSNGLKHLGRVLGMEWRNEKASGIQSIVWRKYWDEGHEEYKDNILFYNQDDCKALQILTNELIRIQKDANVSNDLDFLKDPKKIASEMGHEVHDQFKLVLELAHNDYDRKKIKIDLIQKDKKKIPQKKKSKNGSQWWLGKKIVSPNKSLLIPADDFCFKHPNRKLNKSKIKSKRILVDLVFGKTSVKKIVIEYIGIHGYCPICNNSYPPSTFRQFSRQLYGHNYKSWYVFQRVEIQLSFSKINQCISGLVNDKISDGYGVEFIKDFSKHYENTENKIITDILSSKFIHADETTISISGENQYVWIFTTDKHVTFKLSKSRDAITARDFLKGYKGVLISDFYSGYDAIECSQQKCWVHFIRDLNNSLWDSPFDKEFEDFVCAARNLIIPIIQESNKHGLKKRYFAKHQKDVDKFFKNIIDTRIYKSELCVLYQKRIRRYRDSLFTFLKHDTISWHNNAAENGIRHICVQRKISGSFGEKQFPHYLRMVSIMQTCKLQNKSFFQFLLSKEMDVDQFGLKGKRGTSLISN